MPFKLVISDPKKGKSYQTELEAAQLLGKKIGEKIDGSLIGLAGYELEVRGGSDKIGNPMRKDLPGEASRRILLSKGIGYRAKQSGARKKKRIHGNTISADIVQINLKVTKAGAQALDKILKVEAKEEKPKEEAPKEESKPEEKPAEEKKEEKPKEAKPEQEAPPSTPQPPAPEEKPPEEKPAEKPEEPKEAKTEEKA